MYLKHPKTIKFIFKAIAWELLIIAIICVIIGELDDNLYLLDEFNLAIPSFLGTVLVVTIAFRTNKAYARWWEAKQIWEEIANNTRSFNRFVLTHLSFDVAKRMAKEQVAWAYILAYRLRGKEVPKEYLKYYTTEEIERINKHDNPNQIILLFQSERLIKKYRDEKINIFLHTKMESFLYQIEADMGKAERIKKTIIPTIYDRLIHITIYIFVIIAVYFIDDDKTFFEASVTFIVSALFLAFYRIAKELENPFENTPSDTPMLSVCHNIEQELNDLIGEKVEHKNPYIDDKFIM